MSEKLAYTWPKTKNFFHPDVFDDVIEAIVEDSYCFVSEKLDGSNMCVSSKGYIASRNCIIAREGDKLEEKQFQKQSLKKIEPIFEKARALNNLLSEKLNTEPENLETIVYGEFLVEGTASSKFDHYEYKENGLEVGKLYAFGIGLIFDDMLSSTLMGLRVKKLFGQKRIQRIFVDENSPKRYFIVPLDNLVKHFLSLSGIDELPSNFGSKLSKVLNKDSRVIKNLKERRAEGYIINIGGSKIVKLKYPEGKCIMENEGIKKMTDVFLPPEESSPIVRQLDQVVASAKHFLPMTSMKREDFTVMFDQTYEANKHVLMKDLQNTERFKNRMLFLMTLQLVIGSGYCSLDSRLYMDIEDKIEKRIKLKIAEIDKEPILGVDVTGIYNDDVTKEEVNEEMLA